MTLFIISKNASLHVKHPFETNKSYMLSRLLLPEVYFHFLSFKVIDGHKQISIRCIVNHRPSWQY